MRNYAKKLLSSILVGTLLFTTSSSTVFGAALDRLETTIQGAFDQSNINATVTELGQEEYTSLWTQTIASLSSAQDFLGKIQSDGYRVASGQNGTAFKVTDNNRETNTVYMASKVFQNDVGETIVAMFIYYPQTNSILRIYAEEVGIDNLAHLYYEYENLVLPRTRDFDTVAFLCGMTGTVACLSFSAMLFAFIPASIAVSLTCGAAFNYVCST